MINILIVFIFVFQVEVVGSVCDGISGSSWSPDEELLSLVTATNNLVVMTSQFDIITETSLNEDDFGAQQFINVGWGKKETQFHGSLGKEAAKQKASNGEQDGICSWDDKKARVSWRGDGQLFSVSHITNTEKSMRKLRIFNREGVLQYTSEEVARLEQGLCWRPSGNVLASTQTLPNKHQVVFFEKNGLRHGEFLLPFKPGQSMVKELVWNKDSSVLLLFTQDKETIEDRYILQLWTSSNYHWFLKQKIILNEKVVSLKWDTESSLLLYVLTTKFLYQYTWTVNTDISRGLSVNDLAVVAVINDCKVNLTPFNQAVVPPPMCAYEISFPEAVNKVLFAPSNLTNLNNDKANFIEDSGFLENIDPPGNNTNNLCVYCGDDDFIFLNVAHPEEKLSDYNCIVKINEIGGKGFAVKPKVHRVIGKYKLNWSRIQEKSKTIKASNNVLCNWTWATQDVIIAIGRFENKSVLVVIGLESIGSENGDIYVKTLIPVESKVINITPSIDGRKVVLQMKTGELKVLDLSTNQVSQWKNEENNSMSMGKACNQLLLCYLSGSSDQHPIGLTSRNHLYWGKEQLSSNCTSYHLFNNFLLYTTSSHQLECVPLSLEIFKFLSSDHSQLKNYIGSRKIERGAKIVTALSGKSSVLLQMPRGNLELITPRALLVHNIKQLLSDHNYAAAIQDMRKHRIDMNLICDHNLQDFMDNVQYFVTNIDNPQFIDLFLANLSENDVTKTMYSINYIKEVNINETSKYNISKVDNICICVRKAMIEVDKLKFLLPILTSYVKMTTNEIDVAIKLIQEMKMSSDICTKTKAEEGLRHLLYIADADSLFNVALGTYDFELVMMVFEKSQKDPKECLPFLNSLRKLEENYRKFKIDVHLRRYKKALNHLNNCPDNHFEECMSLIKKEKLYKSALEIFNIESDIYNATAIEYADYLFSKKCFIEAAVMYNRANEQSKAIEAYSEAGNWRKALSIAFKHNYNKEKINHLCHSFIENLEGRRCFTDVAQIYYLYLNNEEDAIENYVKAGNWEEAFTLAYKHNRADLIETNIKPCILEQIEEYKDEINDKITTFNQHFERLVLVRENLEKDHLDFLEGKEENNLDSDLYSDTSTVTGFSQSRSRATRSLTGSQKSGKSHMSSKSKRKLERKKHSTKEGSAFEDLGLVTALHELISSTCKLVDPVSCFLAILLSLNLDAEAKKIQVDLSNLLILIKKNQNQIWLLDNDTENESSKTTELGPGMTTENAIEAFKNRGCDQNNSIIVIRMKQLDAHLRYPPTILNKTNSWQLSILTD